MSKREANVKDVEAFFAYISNPNAKSYDTYDVGNGFWIWVGNCKISILKNLLYDSLRLDFLIIDILYCLNNSQWGQQIEFNKEVVKLFLKEWLQNLILEYTR